MNKPRHEPMDKPDTASSDDVPDTSQRGGHVSSTDAQYGTRSSAGSAAHANADRAHPAARNDSPTRSGAQTGLTGSVGQLDSDKQNVQRPGGANPSAQSSGDWRNQRGEVPSTEDEQARAAAASDAQGRVSGTQAGDMQRDLPTDPTRDLSSEGALDQAHSTEGSSPETTLYPAEPGSGEARHGRSKYSPTANEQDRLSQQQGGESLREDSGPDSGPDSRPDSAGKSS